MKRKMRGVSLVELLLTISITGILAGVFIPMYKNYISRNYYNEVLKIVAPYKQAVVECGHNLKTLDGCSSGSYNIPLAIASPRGVVASLDVENGVINVQPVAMHGVANADNFVLTPTFVAGDVISWVATGRAVLHGYVK